MWLLSFDCHSLLKFFLFSFPVSWWYAAFLVCLFVCAEIISLIYDIGALNFSSFSWVHSLGLVGYNCWYWLLKGIWGVASKQLLCNYYNFSLFLCFIIDQFNNNFSLSLSLWQSIYYKTTTTLYGQLTTKLPIKLITITWLASSIHLSPFSWPNPPTLKYWTPTHKTT